MTQAFLGALISSWIIFGVGDAAAADPLLPLGDVNVLVVTDVHSWIAGHGHQEQNLDADYGDVLAFYELLKAHCDEMGHDLWFVSNGDWIHGTGLSTPGDPSALATLIERMPWDAINCGNHELYEDSVVNHMIQPAGLVDWWGDRYLTSNLRLKADGQFLGRQYKVLRGKKADILVFGFLYNMPDASELIMVDRVEETVAAQWFVDALKNEQYGAILVLAHMDLVDPLVIIIRNAIRKHVGDAMPIQFITGHTHYRGIASVDNMSSSFEAGRYLDTVGFVSFPSISSVMQVESANTTTLFQSIFINGSKHAMEQTLNGPSLSTKSGNDLSEFIINTRRKMGLLEEVGCAPKNYYMKRSLSDNDSIWRLYRDEAVPKMFFSRENSKESNIMFLPHNSWRYDLLSEKILTVDDIWTVAPYNDTVAYMGTFSRSTILQLNVSMNEQNASNIWASEYLPNYILIGALVDGDDGQKYKLFTHDFNAQDVREALLRIDPDACVEREPTPYSSTFIWLAYVRENWPCNGLIGESPDRFPTSNTGRNSLEIGADGSASNAVAIALLILSIPVFYSCLVLCRRWVRCSRWMGVEYVDVGGDDCDGDDKEADETLKEDSSTIGSWA